MLYWGRVNQDTVERKMEMDHLARLTERYPALVKMEDEIKRADEGFL